MGFRGQVHDSLWRVICKHRIHRGAIPDISLYEVIIGRVRHRRHILQTSRIGQRIDIDHIMAIAHRLPDDGRSDKASAPCHQDLH